MKHRFCIIRKQNPRLMHGTSLPWPSLEDLQALVNKASGMFIFASTVADFMTDGNANPQQKLKSVLSLHAGLNPLYGAVPEVGCFCRVLRTIMLLHKQPSINMLADILQLEVWDVLHALKSIQSLIRIPGDDNGLIQLNHRSLRDFLMDRTRFEDLFVDPPSTHFSLAADYVKALKRTLRRDEFPSDAVPLYAIKF